MVRAGHAPVDGQSPPYAGKNICVDPMEVETKPGVGGYCGRGGDGLPLFHAIARQ
jgi:hypothetical protein